MPVRFLRIPNVHLNRRLFTPVRALQTLAQSSATETHNIPFPSLNNDPKHFHPLTQPLTKMKTDILPVDPTKLGKISIFKDSEALIEEWNIDYEKGSDWESLSRAAEELASTDIPVAFPTETVYGLGADATRSSAVRAIFAAKGRPADNPLIVHVHSIAQLRALLATANGAGRTDSGAIPEIYKPLIQQFWPGPLTIILPNPQDSVLAPEVTAGLNTFGARMPRSILALALIRQAGVPLAGPSANASTKPSPTTAEHVKDDLDGRIQTVVDGGPCEVGVESTVVDGLSSPPTILRPGGITVEQLRQCPGWENVVVGYKDAHEKGIRPRAPGMKYRHYSPRAPVTLYESDTQLPLPEALLKQISGQSSVGFIRTKRWPLALGLPIAAKGGPLGLGTNGVSNTNGEVSSISNSVLADSQQSNLLRSVFQHQVPRASPFFLDHDMHKLVDIWDVDLGADTEAVARGLFSALRELDKKGVDVIFVEGIDDKGGG